MFQKSTICRNKSGLNYFNNEIMIDWVLIHILKCTLSNFSELVHINYFLRR